MRVHRRGKGRREPLADSVRCHLLTGRYPARGWDVLLLSDDQKRSAWIEHRAPLLDEWIAARPGSRPWAWWQFTADTPRQVLEGAEWLRPVAPGSRDWEWAWREAFGIPALEPDRPRGVVTVEAQAVYLDRLSLLAPGERKRIPVAQFEPEEIMIPDEDDDTEVHEEE